MIDIKNWVNQDLMAMEKYIELKKFEKANVMGNRILQNLFILNEKKLMIAGFIAKEISLNLLQVQETESKNKRIEELKNLAITCSKKMRSCISSESDVSFLLEYYIDFEITARKYNLDSVEFDAYNRDCNCCKLFALNYLKILIDNKNHLINRNYKFVERVRGEIAILVHAKETKSLILTYVFVRAFELTYKFAINGKIRDEDFEELVSTNIGRMNNIIGYLEQENNEELIRYINCVVGDLMYEYRKYFVLYGDLRGELIEEIALPPHIIEKVRNIVRENYVGKQ